MNLASVQTIKTVIQLRRATNAEWLEYKHVIPAAGEPCFDLNLNTLKIGNGVDSYENLEPIGSAKVDVDGKSIILENGVLKLMGYDATQIGAQPRISAKGDIEWVVPSTEIVDGLQDLVAGLQSDVSNLQNTVTELRKIVMSSDGGTGTLLDRIVSLEGKMDEVDAKIDEKINKFVGNITDDGKVNTLKELVDYVAEHGSETAELAADVKTLKDLVGTTSVKDQIFAIVNKAHVAFEHVKYEVAHKPDSVLVDYREKEIRIMCPVGTKFEVQNSGAGADANAYYIGFKAYAPDGAVSFKEDLAEIIADNTMYKFEDNEFAGVDAYGRKYSIIWLPVARFADGVWTYHGANSSTKKYVGWHYSVEWYDAAGNMIDSDCIRINLTNESCHNNIKPFYLGNVVTEVSVNGTPMDVVDGKVDIVVDNIVKSSDEIIVNPDGTLSVGQIGFDKIVQDTAYTIVIDGGSAIE